jgi:DNA replicative helicase MCM subunit Mcm2 (Cdc46/Mcm family)
MSMDTARAQFKSETTCALTSSQLFQFTHTLTCCCRRHVLSVHSGASRPQGVARGGGGAAAGPANGDVGSDSEPPIDEKTLKRFISYCRSHCFPRLEEQSAGRLVAKYVELRDKVSFASGS